MWEKFFVPISVTLGQGHQATEVEQILPCPHNEVRTAHQVAPKLGRYISLNEFLHKISNAFLEWTPGWNLEFAISQPKMIQLPRNKKQTYWLSARPQMGSSGLTLAMTLTLNFQGQIWNLLYLSWKWSECYEMKCKHIDWTPGLKWPWKMRCQDLTDSDRGDFRCCRVIDSSSFLPNPHNRHPNGLPFSKLKLRFMSYLVTALVNKRLSKQLRYRWFEMPSRSLWCHCNGKLSSVVILSSFEYWYHWNFAQDERVSCMSNDCQPFFLPIVWQYIGPIEKLFFSVFFSTGPCEMW